ncbi:MAG: hypothetical protein AAGI03_01530 [Pseudomonadota bacterium]
MKHETSHPLGCAVFGCTDHACFGFGVTKTDPGVWVCGASLHRAWAIGFLEARSASGKRPLASEREAVGKSLEPPKLTQAPAKTLFQAAARQRTRAA